MRGDAGAEGVALGVGGEGLERVGGRFVRREDGRVGCDVGVWRMAELDEEIH